VSTTEDSPGSAEILSDLGEPVDSDDDFGSLDLKDLAKEFSSLINPTKR
jgi:hypothetical protein